jgi:hypothetical protein
MLGHEILLLCKEGFMKSIQVTTSPLLKQFATVLSEDELALTSKLGTNTISRVRFKSLAFPADEAEQLNFVEELIDGQHPEAKGVLKGMFPACVRDQARAVRELLDAGQAR